MQEAVRRSLGLLYRLETIVACVAFVLVAASLFADVFSREALGNGIFGAQKFAVFATAIAGLLGFTIVVHSGGHLRVSAVDRLFPESWQGPMTRIGDLVSCGICLFLGVYAVQFVASSARLGETDMVFKIKLWPIQAALPYLFFASALRYAAHAAFPALRPEEKDGE
ncbi:MAG: TRAP transporter small permease [Rhodospirillales bacterium]|nr:MAG: TRAP transporter small permease [Rhodospirillales bacterium]